MITFVPQPNFIESAQVLDQKRFLKQIVEAYQMIHALTGQTEGFKNHPAVKMWEGRVDALALYALFFCREYKHRFGKVHSIRGKLFEEYRDLPVLFVKPNQIGGTVLEKDMAPLAEVVRIPPSLLVTLCEKPKWWKGPIHSNHRANLLRKDAEFYGQFAWKEDPAETYFWPTKANGGENVARKA